MAEITQDMTLGQALEFAEARATEANEKNAAKNIKGLKSSISKGNLGETISLDSPYLSTVKSKDYLTNIQAGKGKIKTDFYVKAQALEKYTNQGFVESGLTDLATNVTGATGLAKDVGAKGQLRGEQSMRGMIPFEEIDKIYSQGFSEMKGDKVVSEATKDFLIYHRYTSHRVGTILNNTDDYKSLRLSDISVITNKDGNTSVSIKGEVRGKKKRYATTYTGSFAEFLKGVYDKAKTASPNMSNADIKLFGTSQDKVNKAWKKYLLPKFLDQHEISLPVDRNGKIATGLTEIIRSANIEALESDLGLASNLGDDFMGHTAQGTKAKSYKVNTPESKAIGNITENMVKASAFNLNTGTVNNLFSKYGLNAPSLNVANDNAKVYDGHKSNFKFNADSLKEVVAPRPATVEEINLAKEIAITGSKQEQVRQTDLDIERLGKEQTKLGLQKQVAELTNDETIKKINNQETEKKVKAQIKLENELLGKQDAWKSISADGVEILKAQGLWDDIVAGAKKLKGPLKMAVGPVIAAALYPGESDAAEKRYEEADPNSIRGFIKKGGDTVQNIAETGEAVVTSVAKGFDPGVELGLDIAKIASEDTLESVQQYRDTDVRKGKRQLDVPSYKEKIDDRLIQKRNASSMGLETSEKDMSEVQPMGYAMEQDQSELLRKKVPEAQGFI
tara:strand:+ start:37 stop:2064 length:2028 start_codon:yes stop_codon:yes gene_type:complete